MWNLDVQSVIDVGCFPSKNGVVGQVVTHNNLDRLPWCQVLNYFLNVIVIIEIITTATAATTTTAAAAATVV